MSQAPDGAVLVVVLAVAGLGVLVAFRSGARSGHRAVRRAVVRRFVTWWGRSRSVPLALKSRPALRQAAKDVIVWVARSPGRFTGAVSWGVVVAVRGWRRWVRVHDYRDAAEQSERIPRRRTL
ncbi:MAG: hypothetical protein ACRDSR_27805 [Pseudonocardiaceae bacterium]